MVAAGLAAAVACARAQPVGGPGPGVFAVPSGPIAWFAFDPALFGAGEQADPCRVLIERGLAALLADLPGCEPGAARAVGSVLEVARGRAGAYRVAILDAAASGAAARTRTGPAPLKLARLGAVLDLRVPEADVPEANAGGPRIESRAAGGRVLVSLCEGVEGTLDRWIESEGVRRDQSDPWDAHRARAAAAAGVPDGVDRGSPVLEAYADLSALRRGMPDAFDGTRLHRVLREWRLINARSVMLHVHMVEPGRVRTGGEPYSGAPLLAIELTWSSRSEPPDVIRAASIARAEWPADAASAGLSPQAGVYAAVARAEWGTWLRAVVGTYRVSGSEFEEMTRGTRIASWERKHAAAATRLIGLSSGWAMAWAPGPDEGEPASGLMVLAPFKPDADGEKAQGDLAEVSASIHPGVRFDAPRLWWEAGLPAAGLAMKWMHAGGREQAVLVEVTRGE